MTDRRLSIVITVPMPNSLVESGRIQNVTGQIVEQMREALVKAKVDCTVDFRVIVSKSKIRKDPVAIPPAPTLTISDGSGSIVNPYPAKASFADAKPEIEPETEAPAPKQPAWVR